MKLLLPHKQWSRLCDELKAADRKEIGGLLMGEHVGKDAFKVVDLSVQRSGGTGSCFVRDPKDHQADLAAFYDKTDFDFTRFNYLGEWHSHPSFPARPSSQDLASMTELVNDDAVGVNFLVLLVVKLGWWNPLSATATVFLRGKASASSANLRYGRKPIVWI
jgi:integrative and conjugative element protein (TIGR02256 family)